MVHKAFVFIVFFVSSSIITQAQLHKDSLYLGLKDGTVIQAKTLEIKSPFLAGSYLLVDGTVKHKANTVRFYRDLNGYFLNATTSNNSKEQFYQREFEGKLSLYSKISASYSPGFGVGVGGMGTRGGFGGVGFGGGVRANKAEFIQKGTENNLETLNYKNLYHATKDNEECEVLLKQINNLRTFSTIGYGAGAALIIAGIANTINKNEQSGPPPYRDTSIKISPLLIAGAVVAIIPTFTTGAKRKKMLNVISIYNQ
jgi:hypothetical protein